MLLRRVRNGVGRDVPRQLRHPGLRRGAGAAAARPGRGEGRRGAACRWRAAPGASPSSCWPCGRTPRGRSIEFERAAPAINRLWWRVAAKPDEHVWGCGEQMSYFDLRGPALPAVDLGAGSRARQVHLRDVAGGRHRQGRRRLLHDELSPADLRLVGALLPARRDHRVRGLRFPPRGFSRAAVLGGARAHRAVRGAELRPRWSSASPTGSAGSRRCPNGSARGRSSA